MGLFHYLLVIKTQKSVKKEELEAFFISINFLITNKSDDYVSLNKKTSLGNIEVYMDKNEEISVRTSILNKVEIIDEIISVLQQFAEQIDSEISIYDFQNKQLLNLLDLQELKNSYLKRQKSLENFY